MAIGLNRDELIKSMRNLFGFRGSTHLEISEQLMTIANLADLDEPPFHNKGAGVLNIGTGPVAAQFSHVGLRAALTLPPNFRAVVKMIGVNAAAAMNVAIKLLNSGVMDGLIGAPTLLAIGDGWDSNPPDQGVLRPALQSVSINAVGGLGANGWLIPNVPITANPLIPLKWVIAPGNTLVVAGLTVNTAIQVSFYWDEYNLG